MIERKKEESGIMIESKKEERGKRHHDREEEREKDENLESQENTESEIEGEKKSKKLIKRRDQQTYCFVDEQIEQK